MTDCELTIDSGCSISELGLPWIANGDIYTAGIKRMIGGKAAWLMIKNGVEVKTPAEQRESGFNDHKASGIFLDSDGEVGMIRSCACKSSGDTIMLFTNSKNIAQYDTGSSSKSVQKNNKTYGSVFKYKSCDELPSFIKSFTVISSIFQ